MGWTTTAALGHSLAKGNSDSLFLGATVDSAYRKKHDETFISLIYNILEVKLVNQLLDKTVREQIEFVVFLS